jgi:NMD protein affecting ribosome stability and mRNA decay
MNDQHVCSKCSQPVSKPGLCKKCLKAHDFIINVVGTIMFVLAAFCFFGYYKFFIAM